MEFEKICMIFTMQEPYYGILLSSMDREETKSVPTICVAKSGNVFKLKYNPDFIGSKTVDAILCLLKHETMHLALNHFTLFEGLDVDATTHFIANAAADMEVNSYINFSKCPELVDEGTFASKFGFKDGLGGREYFRLLLSMNQEENKQSGTGNPENKPCNGGISNTNNNTNNNRKDDKKESNVNENSGQSSSDIQNNQNNDNKQPNSELSASLQGIKSFDSHDEWPTDDNSEQINIIIENMLVMAADECEKANGEIPKELNIKITEIRNRRPRPITDWKRYFRRYIGNEFTNIIRKSKKRESRRYPEAAGNKHRRKSHILVAIDTSGSISMSEYHEFFGQLKTLTKDATFHVVECDSAIQFEYDYNGKHNDSVHGGGGTSFYPVTKMFNENRRKYDSLVYFTDGCSNIPEDTPKSTLWVISSKGRQDRERYKVNGASVVFIPKKII